jgi:glycosyltransferase involved in cell wall biosynthesis
MSRKLRVATVITRMTAGAGGVALRGALALDPAEYEVTIIAGGTGFDGRGSYDGAAEVLTGPDAVSGAPAGDLLAVAEAAGLGVARVASLVSPISPSKDRAALNSLTGFIKQGKFDVVHTHSAKAGALGRLAGYRAGVPRIVHTYHGFPFHDYQSMVRRNAYIRMERWLGLRTDAILAVGSAVAADTARLRLISPERICTIAPAVDPIGYPPGTVARGLARRRLELAPGVRVVGTVGRVDYQKAPEQWVDAFAEMATDDIWGVWIGDGPLREKLLARVRKHGLTDRFCFLGHRDDATALLPAFDVFMLASRYEGLPCVLAEAMQARVPIVATAVNSVQDLVVPGITGLLVPPNEPSLLARAAAHLLDNPGAARRMADAAQESLGERFSPHTLGVLLDQTYRGDAPRTTTRSRPAPRPRRSVQWTSQ